MKTLTKKEFTEQLKRCIVDPTGKMNGVSVYVNEDGDIDCGAGLNQGNVFRIEFLNYEHYSDICGSEADDDTPIDDIIDCVIDVFIDEIYDDYIEALSGYEDEL